MAALNYYIAGPWERKGELRKVAEEVLSVGHNVVSSWLWMEEPYPPEGVQAEMDLRALHLAHRLVVFLDPSLPGRGSHVELGYFLGLNSDLNEPYGADVAFVGERTSSFHHLPKAIHGETWEEVKRVFIGSR